MCFRKSEPMSTGARRSLKLIAAVCGTILCGAGTDQLKAADAAGLCPLGVNVANAWDDFVDVQKCAGYSPAEEKGKLTRDVHGWPQGDFLSYICDDRINTPWRKSYPDGVDQDISGVYHLSFTGKGDVEAPKDVTFTVQNQTYDAAHNVTRAEIVLPPKQNLFMYKVTHTTGPV